jgi:hypothetical protein
MTPLLALLACGPDIPDRTDTGSREVTDYELVWSTAPDPLVATETGEFTIEIRDQDGRPIEDLQRNHERMVHTMFVSADWSTFVHTHHEDYAELTVDDIRAATFHFPLTLPFAGPYLILFDYAHQNQWIYDSSLIEVTGTPVQASAPDTTPSARAEVDGTVAELLWSIEPRAGYEAAWTIRFTGPDDAPVTDLVPVLGADAHCAVVSADLGWGSHTHAWFPDMANMSPSMEMPHLYDGPEVPFVYTFPAAGAYRMWVQFARAADPENVSVAPFTFVVGT